MLYYCSCTTALLLTLRELVEGSQSEAQEIKKRNRFVALSSRDPGSQSFTHYQLQLVNQCSMYCSSAWLPCPPLPGVEEATRTSAMAGVREIDTLPSAAVSQTYMAEHAACQLWPQRLPENHVEGWRPQARLVERRADGLAAEESAVGEASRRGSRLGARTGSCVRIQRKRGRELGALQSTSPRTRLFGS